MKPGSIVNLLQRNGVKGGEMARARSQANSKKGSKEASFSIKILQSLPFRRKMTSYKIEDKHISKGYLFIFSGHRDLHKLIDPPILSKGDIIVTFCQSKPLFLKYPSIAWYRYIPNTNFKRKTKIPGLRIAWQLFGNLPLPSQ